MIPKIIHYCWFGGNELPELAKKCIKSWKKYLPDYEIKEWNEDNFDINSCSYCKEAYENERWAYVSDYARFVILYEHGGIYFDTDVEVIKDIDSIVSLGPFMAEENHKDAYDLDFLVAPGLGIGAEAGMAFYKDMIDYYKSIHFTNDTEGVQTICRHVTKKLIKKGLCKSTDIQVIDGIRIYPKEYFCPIDIETGLCTITDKTVTIHHYDGSWMNDDEKRVLRIKQSFARKGPLLSKLGNIIVIPIKLKSKIKRLGIRRTTMFIYNKLITNRKRT